MCCPLLYERLTSLILCLVSFSYLVLKLLSSFLFVLVILVILGIGYLESYS